jgi:adenylate cyclase
MKWSTLISELKRRHVFKSTIAYLAISWIVIQIASTVLPAFNAPEYALKALIYTLSIGLIFWIAFSWVYDLTTDGLQKTDDRLADEETLKLTNKRLNKVIAISLGFAVLLLVVVSFWAGSNWNNNSPKIDLKKVAVIPLVDQHDELEEAYFTTGMTEALIDQLSKVDQLTVISQRSTQVLTSGYQSPTNLMSNVIKGVDYFVKGTVERQLNNITVHLELKELMDAKAIWQKSYTKDLSEVRTLWAEVASDLARQMGVVVKLEDAALWSGLRSVKPETYELYLKGKYYMNKYSIADWQRGMVYLEEALDRNPADPYAYAFLAESYINIGHSPDPPPDVFPKALAAANRAIQLDSTIALGWAALSHYHTYFGKDWAMAEHAFERANELNPNLADNHYHRAWYLALFGRMNEAIAEHKLAQELDPFVPLHTAWLGGLYRMVGEYEKGLIETEKAAQMENGYTLSMYIEGEIFFDQGEVEEGLKMLKNTYEVEPGWIIGYGPALIEAGYIKEAKTMISELEKQPLNGYRALVLASMHDKLRDFDKAFEYLNYKQKHGWYPWIRVLFFSDEIRKDPRFLKIIRDMNLPDPAPFVYHPEG